MRKKKTTTFYRYRYFIVVERKTHPRVEFHPPTSGNIFLEIEILLDDFDSLLKKIDFCGKLEKQYWKRICENENKKSQARAYLMFTNFFFHPQSFMNVEIHL